MVAGLETINSGEVQIAGKVVNNKEAMDRDIAIVFQNYALYPHMAVHQNMGYSLKLAGYSKSKIEQKVQAAADLIQLSELLSKKPQQISGGQRQRVATGRAIVREPSVFLFDEPLSNLDAKLRVQMRLKIRELQRKLGITFLYVTHDQVEAMTMADRMIVMNEGYAEQIGTPLEVYQRPETLFSAQFIGSPAMNVFDAYIHSQELRISAKRIGEASMPNRKVTLGIRPEHLVPSPNVPFTINVNNNEDLCANTLLHGNLKQSEQKITVSLPGAYEFNKIERQMSFEVNSKNIHLFCSTSGQRL